MKKKYQLLSLLKKIKKNKLSSNLNTLNFFSGFIDFNFISAAITNGLMQLSILNKKPIGNAVLTCLNEKQTKLRASKGYEAAIAVSEVLNGK